MLEKLEWYVRASRHAGFHRDIARRILPLLKPEDSLVDFGCGPGLMTTELYKSVKHIHAIDVNPIPIGFLQAEAARIGAANITAEVADATGFEKEFDVGLFCYFVGDRDFLQKMFARARRLSIVVMHGDADRPLQSIGPAQLDLHRAYASEMKECLDAAGYDYTWTEEAHEFGQPLKSLEEARAFFEIYTSPKGKDPEGYIRDEIERKLAAVVKTADAEYPYYYPHTRDAAIFVIRK
jgi:hypothetical protein